MASRFLYWSTIAKKIIMALSGLFLILYLIVHLAANLTILTGNPEIINKYAHTLESFGWLLYVVEAVLVAGFLIHIVSGTMVWWENRKARPEGYVKHRSKGSPSRQTISSRTMIYTGAVILIFVIIHVKTFKYGDIPETVIGGVAMRDFYSVVVRAFKDAWIVTGYVAVMVFLGFHLRHAFWSAFQSLGTMTPRLTPVVYTAGVILAIVLSVGFIFIPIWVFFSGGVQ
jgi:succinate dehydrogenase / fumarate reductase cytochrome b subunit